MRKEKTVQPLALLVIDLEPKDMGLPYVCGFYFPIFCYHEA